MNEFELIARLKPGLATNASVRVGAGDDCAVLDWPCAEGWLLFKTDAVVEGVHFTRETAPERVGHKALARCFSDMAAMAGRPTHALITLGIPKPVDVEYVEGLYRGMNALAQRYEVAIAGGETTESPERIFLSVTVLGTVPKERCVLRSGAKPGDAIFVTGQLGGSLDGKHLEFEPRIKEAAWLTEHFEIHAMIDLSDGLAGDLRHVTEASGAGAELLESAIPISRAARVRAREVKPFKPALLAALTDGEDFELLFTLPSRSAVPLLDRWKEAFPETQLSCIGRITERRALILKGKDGFKTLPTHGYTHFA